MRNRLMIAADSRSTPLPRQSARPPIGRARYPVVDAHNHLFGDTTAEEMIAIMDAVGVETFINVTGNCVLPFESGGYAIRRRPFEHFRKRWIERFPGRFAAFTMSEFARWDDFALFSGPSGAKGFVDRCLRQLEADVAEGACGLKVTKELGLRFTDERGHMIAVDDERLFPIWRRAGEMGLPVLIHVSDPVGFFQPVDEANEHLATLREFPGWSFHGSFYGKDELIEQRDRMIAEHPGTRFLLPHVANYPEDLERVSRLIARFDNVWIDFSARMDELGRQPCSAREFMITWQDRILFGADMPLSTDVYRCYVRFLETRDENFEYVDYLGRWGHARWRIHGLGLPETVLEKIYRANARALVPGLAR
jgi:predicted TIM-barrel fold metal-dependent hydrolase